jgi:bifunctional non-homologous end joining protein LigD
MPSKRQRARTGPDAFTLDLPHPLDARKDGDAWWVEVDGRELRLSNLNKIFWPEEGYTKGDLVAYYANVARLIVPHLAERPLTMKRMPDGIDGPFFYEKSAPSHVPDWIGRCKVSSDDAKTGVIDYMTIEDASGLLFISKLVCTEFISFDF